MRFQRCTNLACLRPFQVNEFAGKKTGVKTPQEIICPHCEHKETLWSDHVFLVHALSAEEEAEFNAANPIPAQSP
jgi:hypothetical protein